MEPSSKKQLLNPSSDGTRTASDIGNVSGSTSETKYNVCFMVQLVTIAALGGFLFGYDTGVIAGTQLYFKDDWPDITDS